MKNSAGTASLQKKNLPHKKCVACQREFTWRKKWEKVWDEVKYCSKRCRGEKTPSNPQASELGPEEVDRVIRMAWEDRTPFEAILAQFALSESQTIELMRRNLKPARFAAWRKRVHEHGRLKSQATRDFKLGVFKSRMQRIDGSIQKPQ